MGDIAEDMSEALRVIEVYTDACEEAVAEVWRMNEGLGTQDDVDTARADVKSTRKEMEETLRALLDPRACA